MKIHPPTPFRPDRARECARIIQEAVGELEREALEAGWTPAELSEAFTRYAQGAQLRALPRTEYASVADQIVRQIAKPKRDES